MNQREKSKEYQNYVKYPFSLEEKVSIKQEVSAI